MRRLKAAWLRFSIWQADLSIELMSQQIDRNLGAINELRRERDQAALDLLNLEMDRP